MGKVFVGINTEFSRSSDKPFEWAVEETAKMGFEYIEPMVHFGRELMSEAGFFPWHHGGPATPDGMQTQEPLTFVAAPE